MYSFEELTKQFADKFGSDHFAGTVRSLYEPAEYFLGLGGKRVRPVLCLMGNELFESSGGCLAGSQCCGTVSQLYPYSR